MNIVLAEDNPAVMHLYAQILENTPYTLFFAENGVDAFAQYLKTNSRMVITDWTMPEMDGIELCQKIREHKSSHYTYIIFVTSMDREKDAVMGLDAGADDYIKKPFHAEELLARIRSGVRILELEDRVLLSCEELHKAEQMASLGRLAAGIAHEINNPLGFITSNLEILRAYREDQQNFMEKWRDFYRFLEKKSVVDEEIKKQADHIKKFEDENELAYIMDDFQDLLTENLEGVQRIADIVKDMKAFGRPGDDSLVKRVDINREIETTVRVVKQDVSFNYPIHMDLGDIPKIECRPAHLNQVFYALLANAAHATRKKGRVRILTRAENNHLRIMVSDSGEGIPYEVLPKLFDPFFSTKEVGEGKGMGLNVAYHVVKSHGGRIKVKSDYGKGSVFTLLLPLQFEETASLDKKDELET
ncbi:MAG: response regulator [Desulfobacteraceae bacterium]